MSSLSHSLGIKLIHTKYTHNDWAQGLRQKESNRLPSSHVRAWWPIPATCWPRQSHLLQHALHVIFDLYPFRSGLIMMEEKRLLFSLRIPIMSLILHPALRLWTNGISSAPKSMNNSQEHDKSQTCALPGFYIHHRWSDGALCKVTNCMKLWLSFTSCTSNKYCDRISKTY